MKITLENTSKIVELEIQEPGGPLLRIKARIWEGTTDSGIPVHAYLTRIAVAVEEDQAQFERELQACRTPSAAVEAIPTRLVI